MRWEHGIALLDRHLARSAAAAAALGFPFDRSAIYRTLQQTEATLDDNKIYRLRMTLDKDGRMNVAAAPLQPDAVAFRIVGLDSTPVDSSDALRAFKTTRRNDYERAYQTAKVKELDEAILLNERHEIVEGTRTNVWARLDGQWITPPLQSGCLPGVYRAYMLETWEGAAEAVLRVDDLIRAEQLGLSNAVHGFLPVDLVIDR